MAVALTTAGAVGGGVPRRPRTGAHAGLAAKDRSTEEHTRRVAALAVEMGERLGLPARRLPSLAIGGLLHDMGKLSVPDAILQKPGPLDDEEFAQIELHPQRGYELLTELGSFDEAVKRLVLDHHERLDGRGYPRRLEADDLGLESGSSLSATSTTLSSRRGSTDPPGR
jgi:HD-GYP domain-containing protein (c-di-GMP phosphodiesterase class II)